ncbi:gluconate 2-dehydrogenase subunit 3 family protein [Natronococcus jeotgali]|uniref:Gluconate 2-dehydrogenase subunit 3 family protein n=1 Tax=Natronococcus jeotgali DSM 18795 TaxID=1227498 RepID=L9XVS9_9EURY|nr:gluconate 2-dehydrogenase subunit 3 family protein [Natronococcus jeotgali]ELY65607.1 hypothetical protein C492_02969 [Natronococcus jeotgali DSM 18795]
MELTRRDAVAALAALGVGGGAALGVGRLGRDPDADGGVDAERIRETQVAAAAVVYPSEVSGTREFVETFLEGRLEQPAHAAALEEAVAELDDRAESWYGDAFAVLSVADRERVLEQVGADTADEDPDGTTAERIRYYVVNELLLALYASPTGGELVGLENPQGHAGGLETYRRGPEA